MSKSASNIKNPDKQHADMLHSDFLRALFSKTNGNNPLRLADLIDVPAVQHLMDCFHAVTGCGVGIHELDGEVLIATGWQEVCTEFHRKHPETCSHCRESDTVLSSFIEPGTFRQHRCKNRMWDIVTPIYVHSEQIGNVFFGQFFFDDEEVDYEAFHKQARTYDFDEEAYLAAIDKVPRCSRKKVDEIMRFYASLAKLVSELSFANLMQRLALQEKDRHQHQLEIIKERYKTLFDNAPVGVLAADIESKQLVLANPAIADFLGYSRTDLLELLVTDIHPEESLPQVLSGFEEQARGERILAAEVPCLTRGGRIVYADIKSAQMELDGRQCLVGFFTDVTAKLKAREEKQQLEHQLRQAQKMEIIGTLAGGIAHDYNNILSAMFGYLEMALLKTRPNDPLRQYLDETKKAAQRAADLTEQILVFSGYAEEERINLDFSPTIKDAVRFLRAALPANINIISAVKDDSTWLNANPIQLYQLVLNLCVNAFHAMEERGGEIELMLDKLRIDYGAAVNVPPGAYLRLQVRDNGCGMDQATLSRIFEPFYTTKEVGKGSGLGLSVVYGVVKNHGGEIEVESRPGEGSVFSVYLPALENLEKAGVVRPTTLYKGTGNERILLVDDEASLVETQSAILTRLGYQVSGTTSAAEAIELFVLETERFDLLISDQSMPEMSGLELAAKLRELEPGLAVIISSGFSEKLTPETIREMGINGYLKKPAKASDLSRAIREVLDANQDKPTR